MLTSTITAAMIGCILGFLAGLGVGGGSLLVLWLTLVLGMPYPQVRVWNLLFFLPASLISSGFRLQQKTLPINKVWPAMALGCISAGIFSMASPYIQLGLLQKGFGILLLFTGIRELLYKKSAGSK